MSAKKYALIAIVFFIALVISALAYYHTHYQKISFLPQTQYEVAYQNCLTRKAKAYCSFTMNAQTENYFLQQYKLSDDIEIWGFGFMKVQDYIGMMSDPGYCEYIRLNCSDEQNANNLCRFAFFHYGND